ncbi:MAG: hypothetical protein LAN62_16045 [Acidobacteriia bacterium]|nr:hypothetical protein [Terriglobia bacterium]
MSCNATFPPETEECPHCQVSLSIVRKCPSCGRVQSAQHFACIYCANSFLREHGLRPLAAGPLSRRAQAAERRLLIAVGTALAVLAAVGVTVYLLRRSPSRAPAIIAQTYVLHATSMRAKPSPDAAPVKDFRPSQILNITDSSIDVMGDRWYQVTDQGLEGYMRLEDVAPPKALDPEKGYEALRHWLLGMNNPSAVREAREAVEFYRKTYPTNLHGSELQWLLAEGTRNLAEGSRERGTLLASAREQYQKIAQAGGEYADRARQTLEQLPTDFAIGTQRRTEPPSTFGFSVVGGSAASSRNAPAPSSQAPIRRVTVLSRTPLYVRLTSPVRLSTGTTFEAEFSQDIWVNKEIAIPSGSPVRLAVSMEGGTPSLRIIDAVISGETYPVSASLSRIESPDRTASRGRGPASLPAGTQVEFRLDAPLIVTYR